MKKIFTVLFAIMLLLNISPLTAFAEEYREYVEADQNSFEGQTTIDYHAYSSYYVSIPTNISEYDSYGTIAVTMDNIEDGHHIEVYITNLDENGLLTVTSDNGNTGQLSVLYDNGLYTANSDGLIGEFYPETYNYTGCASTNIAFDKAMMDNFKAGTYHGVICFRVECVSNTK